MLVSVLVYTLIENFFLSGEKVEEKRVHVSLGLKY